MTTEWNISPYTREEEQSATQLATETSLLPDTCRLLLRRGITTKEEVEAFLHPSLDNLHDPFLMNDMDKAVKRLNEAVSQCQKILIYGDYDVDGTTSVTLIYRFLRETVYSDTYLNYYIPDRYDDGYGVSFRGIDYAHKWGAKLIIVLDCGIKAIEEIAYAKKLGIDFIICDHHNPDTQLPEAVAVLDPKRKDNNYPFEHLSGCGVGFKLLQAFSISNNIPLKYIFNQLELLALSIASDTVPVVDENRILAYHGLKQLNKYPSLGVQGLMKISGLEHKKIDMQSIVFKIGPRINASGRMMNGREAVTLLISKNPHKVKIKSDELNQYNDQRRELDFSVTEEAITKLKQGNYQDKKIIIIANEEWHKGVIGIVASRIAERCNRPTIILSRNGETLSGSARSVGGFDIYKAVESCKDLLKNFGGHPYAVGMTIESQHLKAFQERIETYAQNNIDEKLFRQTIDVDAVLNIKDLSARFRKEINDFAPFGAWNEKPVFMSQHLYATYGTRIIGKDHKHLKIAITNQQHTAPIVSGIAFKQAKWAKHILSQYPFSLLYTIEDNTTSSRNSTQILIQDIKIE